MVIKAEYTAKYGIFFVIVIILASIVYIQICWRETPEYTNCGDYDPRPALVSDIEFQMPDGTLQKHAVRHDPKNCGFAYCKFAMEKNCK